MREVFDLWWRQEGLEKYGEETKEVAWLSWQKGASVMKQVVETCVLQ